MVRPAFPRAAVLTLILSCLALWGCSITKLAINSLGNAMAEGGETYASDDDPELVKGAIPFGLKTIEGLLAQSPEHAGLLLAAVSGFTQYAYAFVQSEADYVEGQDFARASELRQRARRLYRRALEYGLRGLEVGRPGFRDRLRSDPAGATATVGKDGVGLLYWTAAAWGSAISLDKTNAELTADLGLAEALARRALLLDEGFGSGTVHDFLLVLEAGRPTGGAPAKARAREHFARAVSLSKGKRAAPYVSLAESVAVAAQDRKEFEALLAQALAIDPDEVKELRLANLVAQKRARWLQGRAGDLFLE